MPKINQIIIKIIPDTKQRIKGSLGDYWLEGDTLQVRVSQDADWRREWGIILHELDEFGICLHRGIEEPIIQAFDESYKGNDPGTHPTAPYHKEHQHAEEVEEMFYEAVNYEG